MKYSGVGGQAVMEGIMMRNGDRYAVAVRKSDHEIEVAAFDYVAGKKAKKLRKLPILRGVFGFVDSLYLGMTTLMYSASFFEDEEEKKKNSDKQKDETKEQFVMGATVAVSILLAVALFFALPFGISLLLGRWISSRLLLTCLEGVTRLAIFISYIALISLMPDIRRTYMYHGAEHKCINCIEHGLPLTVENVRNSSKEHKRCGTSFLIIVMLISIVFFMFIRVDSPLLKLFVRLLLIPVIAGVSFEFLRAAGRYDNAFMNFLSKPGLLMQKITTLEPDDEIIEVGIASVNAVFDWESWQKEEGLV